VSHSREEHSSLFLPADYEEEGAEEEEEDDDEL
jgi:hypothetical protein